MEVVTCPGVCARNSAKAQVVLVCLASVSSEMDEGERVSPLSTTAELRHKIIFDVYSLFSSVCACPSSVCCEHCKVT